MENVKNNAQKFMSEFLRKQPLMQIATLDDSNMWIATVWYASDEDFNLYFLSKDFRIHSKHIEKNPNVVCAISGQYKNGPGEKIQGIQLKGIANKVSGLEMISAYKTYASKWTQLLKIGTIEAFKGNTAGINMYKVKPIELVWFDEINFADEPRIEINLDKKDL